MGKVYGSRTTNRRITYSSFTFSFTRMMNNRERHLKFLNMELVAETEEFDKKFSAKALYLLNESEDLFMGQFLKFDNGEMIVRFRATRSFPRKGEYTQAMYLPSKLQDYRQWGDKTYEDLSRIG